MARPGRASFPEANTLFAYGAPGQTAPLADALEWWDTITRRSDPWQDGVITPAKLVEARPGVTYGNLLLRTTYHEWYRMGENETIRQMLGHADRPVYVGDVNGDAPYRPPPTG